MAVTERPVPLEDARMPFMSDYTSGAGRIEGLAGVAFGSALAEGSRLCVWNILPDAVFEGDTSVVDFKALNKLIATMDFASYDDTSWIGEVPPISFGYVRASDIPSLAEAHKQQGLKFREIPFSVQSR